MKSFSIITPIYNEEKNIPVFYKELVKVLDGLKEGFDYEIILVNDGSQDKSEWLIEDLALQNPRVKFIEFSRNFGKEVALTAGLNNCKGDAAITIDADLQHPAQLINELIVKWKNGAEVVIGVRKKNKSEGIIKRFGSWLFYKIMSRISETNIIHGSTDFRLIDRKVINEFNRLTEKNRITRGLIDWLGFRREYVYFDVNARRSGEPAYNFIKLVRLALSSFVSLSLFPLKFAGYLGIFITLGSGVFGLFIFIEKYILRRMYFSGPAILAVIILFLVGIILCCLGLIALYIANIHTEVISRPIYVMRKSKL